MNTDTFLTWLPFILIPYLLYRRYRASMSLTPPSPLYRYLATKTEGVLRITGGIIMAAAAVAYYTIDSNDVTRGIFILITFVGLIGLFLVANPDYLLGEAYLYNEDEEEWRKLKQDAIKELRKNYWKIVLKRLLLVTLLIAIFWLFAD